MAQVSTYTVNVRRGDTYWIVEVPEVRRVTQARHLREVDAMASDLISIMTEQEPDLFDLDVHIDIPDDVRRHLDCATKLREDARGAQAEAAEEVRVAARILRDSGLALRDIGTVLGVSHQRADQLVRS